MNRTSDDSWNCSISRYIELVHGGYRATNTIGEPHLVRASESFNHRIRSNLAEYSQEICSKKCGVLGILQIPTASGVWQMNQPFSFPTSFGDGNPHRPDPAGESQDFYSSH